MTARLQRLEQLIREFYDGFTRDERNDLLTGHWWDHVGAVSGNVAKVAVEEQLEEHEYEVVVAAALCHDLGYSSGGSDQEQADRSMEMAREFGVAAGFEPDEASEIADLIPASDRDLKIADTRLERILYVGDKLDLFGSAGTVRLLVEEAAKGVSVRFEYAQSAAERQKDWLAYMRRLGVGSRVVDEYAEKAEQLISSVLAE